MNPEETSHQMITNLSTAPVICGHCTLFSETNTARVAKNRTIPPHRKHLENSMTELNGGLRALQIFSCLRTHYRLL